MVGTIIGLQMSKGPRMGQAPLWAFKWLNLGMNVNECDIEPKKDG